MPSCTAALEAAAILLDLAPGDEVIMPSFTFVSTANAFVLRGAVPVFVDVRGDTLNIDEDAVAEAVTSRTRAIVPVHYAGVGCEMGALMAIADHHGLRIVEDAAQGIMADYRGRPLGAMGDLGAFSFHETKNVTCGEGGALLVNAPDLVERAEVIRDKGTNRSRFLRGQVDKYTWMDLGSSFLLSDVNAAFLYGQLEAADAITQMRLDVWERYHAEFEELERDGLLRRPVVPDNCRHNAHMYYLLLPTAPRRHEFLSELKTWGVDAVFHYVPLHSSPAGLRHGRAAGRLWRTDDLSARLARLPLWPGMPDSAVERVVEAVHAAVGRPNRRLAMSGRRTAR
jgi:dTDP-4-amino-4,6-dideoxygalactose transaminase